MEDIAPKLLQAVKEAYEREKKKDRNINKLTAKLSQGKASWTEADEYARCLSGALTRALRSCVSSKNLPDGRMYYNIASRLFSDRLRVVHDETSGFSVSVQKKMNSDMGIGVRAVEPKYNEYLAGSIIDKVSDAEIYDEISGTAYQDVEHFSQCVVTDTMKENAGLHENLGFQVTVDREYDGVGLRNRTVKCEFCSRLAGHWTYKDAMAIGVFGRHPGCGCTIIYNSAKSSQIQTRWQNNTWQNTQDPSVIERRKKYGTQLRITQVAASTISEKVKSGEFSLRLTKQQYNKHIENTKQYADYIESRKKKGLQSQSILTISFEEAGAIVANKSGTGIIKVRKDGTPMNIEFITCDKHIGKYLDKGKWHLTNKAAIHHGKKGSHIYPIKGNHYD